MGFSLEVLSNKRLVQNSLGSALQGDFFAGAAVLRKVLDMQEASAGTFVVEDDEGDLKRICEFLSNVPGQLMPESDVKVGAHVRQLLLPCKHACCLSWSPVISTMSTAVFQRSVCIPALSKALCRLSVLRLFQDVQKRSKDWTNRWQQRQALFAHMHASASLNVACIMHAGTNGILQSAGAQEMATAEGQASRPQMHKLLLKTPARQQAQHQLFAVSAALPATPGMQASQNCLLLTAQYFACPETIVCALQSHLRGV